TVGNLAVGESATITIVVVPNETGPSTNTAAVSGNEVDSNLANNSASTTTRVIARRHRPICRSRGTPRPGEGAGAVHLHTEAPSLPGWTSPPDRRPADPEPAALRLPRPVAATASRGPGVGDEPSDDPSHGLEPGAVEGVVDPPASVAPGAAALGSDDLEDLQ